MAIRRLAAFILANSVLLPIGAAIALVWANVDHVSYDALAHRAHFAVNDVGMVLFFALAAKEIVEATARGGALHPLSKAATPIVAAAGGMAAPAALFLWLAWGAAMPALARGWAIPSATDIAFSFLVGRWLFGRTHPAVAFLLLLAIADDALGLVVLAVFYPAGIVRPLVFAALVAAALVVCVVLRRRRVRDYRPYVGVGGLLAWLGFFHGGLHPALALVPIIPFVPHAARDQGWFAGDDAGDDALARFEHAMRIPTELVLFLFGLVNAGVPLGDAGPGTWIVLAALVVGKPVGIVAASALARAFGASLPPAIRVRELLVIGVTAGIGFTVALFFCTAAFAEDDVLLVQTKMGALFSFLAAPLAIGTAMALGVGRFARRRGV